MQGFTRVFLFSCLLIAPAYGADVFWATMPQGVGDDGLPSG